MPSVNVISSGVPPTQPIALPSFSGSATLPSYTATPLPSSIQSDAQSKQWQLFNDSLLPFQNSLVQVAEPRKADSGRATASGNSTHVQQQQKLAPLYSIAIFPPGLDRDNLAVEMLLGLSGCGTNVSREFGIVRGRPTVAQPCGSIMLEACKEDEDMDSDSLDDLTFNGSSLSLSAFTPVLAFDVQKVSCIGPGPTHGVSDAILVTPGAYL